MTFPRRTAWLEPRGIVADVPPFAVPDQYLTGGDNIVFRNGHVERIKGERSAYATVQDDVLNLINTLSGSVNYWVYFGTDKAYVSSPSAHTDITPVATLTGVSAAYQWSSCTLNGVVVANNQIEDPIYWNGSPASKMATLTGWPASTKCKLIAAHRYHLFAFNMTEAGGDFPSKMIWSDAAQPGTIPNTWTAAASNEAGDAELSENDTPIVAASTLRDTLLVYKSDAVHSVNYVGGQNIYENRPLFTSFGALTPRSVLDLNGTNFVVGDGDLFLTDGVTFRSVGQEKIRRLIFDNLDQDNYQMLFCSYNKSRDEVWVCYPTAGNSLCDKAVVFARGFNEWGTRDLPSVSCAAAGIVNDTAPSQVIDDQTAVIDTVNTPIDSINYSLASQSLMLGVPGTPEFRLVDQDDVTTVAAVARRHDLTLGAAERIKVVRRVHLNARNYNQLHVRIGSRMRPDDAITWSTEQTLTHPESVVDRFAQGRYISLEVRSSDAAPWELTSFGLEVEFRGYA